MYFPPTSRVPSWCIYPPPSGYLPDVSHPHRRVLPGVSTPHRQGTFPVYIPPTVRVPSNHHTYILPTYTGVPPFLYLLINFFTLHLDHQLNPATTITLHEYSLILHSTVLLLMAVTYVTSSNSYNHSIYHSNLTSSSINISTLNFLISLHHFPSPLLHCTTIYTWQLLSLSDSSNLVWSRSSVVVVLICYCHGPNIVVVFLQHHYTWSITPTVVLSQRSE